MKHIIILLTFTLILTACHTSIPESHTPDATQPADEVSQPVESVLEDYPNLAPLALLSAYIDEEGDIWVDSSEWTSVDPDLFREYMFGTWKGIAPYNQEHEYLILDDSEKAAPINYRNAFGYYQYNDIIIFYYTSFQVTSVILWLDINDPDILYAEEFDPGNQSYLKLESEVNYLTRTDAPINQPENGFMSRLRLYEIMRDYDIPAELIFYVDYMSEDSTRRIYTNGAFCTFPIYLVLQEPDKFVFKSSSIIIFVDDFYIDFTYTLEKTNGEWVRTVDVDCDESWIQTPYPEERNYSWMGL
jgi:hypothetical protein